MDRVPPPDAVAQAPFIVPAAVDDAGLTVYQFRALAHAVRRAGLGGRYYGAGTRSAKACRMSVRQWRTATADLVRLGYLVLESSVRGKPNVYRVETSAPRALVQEVHRCQTDTSAGGAPDQCTTCTPTSAPRAPKGVPLRSPLKDSASPAARRVEASPSKPSKVTTTATNGAGKVVQAEVLSSERAWSREACQDWIDRFDGTAPGGQIGKALKPLVSKHGWDEVRRAWQSYLSQIEAEYASPSKFAATFGRWSGSAAPARKQTAEDRTRANLAAWVASKR